MQEDTIEDIIEVLKKADIRPSYQRVVILKTLRSTTAHPTADELLRMVNSSSEFEISRATLYNTLQLFNEHGIIVQVDTNANETHFEPNINFHPHFICTKCKRVFDTTGELPEVDIPDGFIASNYTVNVLGICSECVKKAEDRPEG